MSLLSEPRRRQRLSVDPQNVQWKNDDQKISRKLMERMGWSEGDGLGRNGQGSSSNVKLKANYTGKGLGADKLASYDSTWIGHHDDFADLLNALNKNKEKKEATEEEKQERAKKISLELNSKSLRRRIHYQKFTRAKDMSNYTENDRAAVLGIGLSKNKRESPEKVKLEESVEQKEETSTELASNTTVSTLSVAEYFAAKMAAMKTKKEEAQSDVKADFEVNTELVVKQEEINEYSTSKERRKKKKELRRLEESMKYETPSETCEVKVEVVEGEETPIEDEEMRKQRRREKKLKRRQERAQQEIEEAAKKMKQDKDSDDGETIEVTLKEEKRRERNRNMEGYDDSAEAEQLDGEIKQKKKKSKKNKQDSEP